MQHPEKESSLACAAVLCNHSAQQQHVETHHAEFKTLKTGALQTVSKMSSSPQFLEVWVWVDVAMLH